MTETRLPYDVYLDHLEAESARFADALAGVEPGGRVPACPDLGRLRPRLPPHRGAALLDAGGQPATVRPATRSRRSRSLPGRRSTPTASRWYGTGPTCCCRRCGSTAPETPAWTWSNEQSVGFTYRRQAHEALIHRLDAEQAAGTPTGMPPALGADGVDECLRIMYGGCPPWGTITPNPGRTARIRCTDTDDTWLVTTATFAGDDPGGEHVEEPDIHVAESDDGSDVPASISGSAADLDAWLWHRVGDEVVGVRGGRGAVGRAPAGVRPGDQLSGRQLASLGGRPFRGERRSASTAFSILPCVVPPARSLLGTSFGGIVRAVVEEVHQPRVDVGARATAGVLPR